MSRSPKSQQLKLQGNAQIDAKQLRIVPLSVEHLPQALGLSSALGWPYRLEDWSFALGLGIGFAVELDGRLIATALYWKQGTTHASLGMIIVDPAMQGRGIGRSLMTRLLKATQGRTVFLNSTEDGLALYTQLGFVSQQKVYQHQAVLERIAPYSSDAAIHRMSSTDEALVRQIDAIATGIERTALLDALFSVATVSVLSREETIYAYACVRRFGRGVVIGPVVASGTSALDDAKALIASLAKAHLNQFVRVDVTELSGLSEWLTNLGLPRVDHATSMTLNAQKRTNDPAFRLFALCNQSLG